MSSASSRVIEAEYPAEPQIVHDIRRTVEEFIRPCGFSEEDVEAIKVAISEASSNAVCHGSPKGSLNRIHVRCEDDGKRLVMEVVDEGRGFAPPKKEGITLPDFDEWKPSGRGLFLINALVDDVEFETLSHGTRVRLVKHFPNSRGGARPTSGVAAGFGDAGTHFAHARPAVYHDNA